MLAEAIVSQDDPWKGENPAYCPGGNCLVGRAWSEGNLVTTAYGINNAPPLLVKYAPWSWHPGQAAFAFADGHSAFISQNINQSVLTFLTTRRPGKDVSGNPYGGEIIPESY
jgi:prepilin-type processing-associated H-X9-DG protein